MVIGYCFCGSYCTLSASIAQLELLCRQNSVVPIINDSVANVDTRFGVAQEVCDKIERICAKKAIRTVKEAEPLGPSPLLDIMVIAPCTGNTLSRIAHGISDSAVTMAAKAHLRSGKPLLICLASNDAMGANFVNLATLSQKKNIFFLPMRQDDPARKPFSLVCEFTLLSRAIDAAMNGEQLRPLFL